MTNMQRLGFLELCNSTQPNVVRGQLRAIFAAEKSRAIEAGAVCDSATQLDDGINKKLLDFVAGFKIGGKVELKLASRYKLSKTKNKTQDGRLNEKEKK